MSVASISELLTETAGDKIFMTENGTSIDIAFKGEIYIILENIKYEKQKNKNNRAGDCLIIIDGRDLIEPKIIQIASLVHHYEECDLKLFIWRYVNEGVKGLA